jgi:hypothetical protein
MTLEEIYKEIILVGEDKHGIEVKPVTLIYKAPDLHQRLSYPGRVELDTEATMFHMGKVKVFHEHTPRMVAHVFEKKEVEQITPDWCRHAGSGVMHCAGLIDLSLKLAEKWVPVAWIHPESFLHPRAQCQLADIVIELGTNPPETAARKQDRIADEIAEGMLKDD